MRAANYGVQGTGAPVEDTTTFESASSHRAASIVMTSPSFTRPLLKVTSFAFSSASVKFLLRNSSVWETAPLTIVLSAKMKLGSFTFPAEDHEIVICVPRKPAGVSTILHETTVIVGTGLAAAAVLLAMPARATAVIAAAAALMRRAVRVPVQWMLVVFIRGFPFRVWASRPQSFVDVVRLTCCESVAGWGAGRAEDLHAVRGRQTRRSSQLAPSARSGIISNCS